MNDLNRANELNEQTELLTLSEAAEHLSTSRSRIWRAKESGELLVSKDRINGRKVWCVRRDDLERWASTWLDSSELNTLNTSDDSHETTEHSEQNTPNRVNEQSEQSEHFGQKEQFAILTLVEKLHLEQRRSITLELQLQQTQRLLCERNDDQHEREARAKEAEEKANTLALELESLKTEMSAREARWAEERQTSKPWWKRMFG